MWLYSAFISLRCAILKHVWLDSAQIYLPLSFLHSYLTNWTNSFNFFMRARNLLFWFWAERLIFLDPFRQNHNSGFCGKFCRKFVVGLCKLSCLNGILVLEIYNRHPLSLSLWFSTDFHFVVHFLAYSFCTRTRKLHFFIHISLLFRVVELGRLVNDTHMVLCGSVIHYEDMFQPDNSNTIINFISLRVHYVQK